MTNSKKLYAESSRPTPTPPSCYEPGKTSKPEVVVCRFAFGLDTKCQTCEWARRVDNG